MLRRARLIEVRGTVQGVGFRPFAFRLAQRHRLGGWVTNGPRGVEIHIEGPAASLDAFARALTEEAPPAAHIASLDMREAVCGGHERFAILPSVGAAQPTARIAPDLPVCAACLRELFDPRDRRYRYPYINCTDCGPRYSIVLGLPYDRALTTMNVWPMCAACAAEYHDPANRRFHAQPVACAACGPSYVLESGSGDDACRADDAIAGCARLLREGAIVALKGIGGYHLACDARRPGVVGALRDRKFRKERPFAVMARDVATARELVTLDAAAEGLLNSSARPIVLAGARTVLEAVAPENCELGIMLPYAPLHHLLFAAGAPSALVVTSANRSSEPIAFEDGEARTTLAGIADAFMRGERGIARRIDDSVGRVFAGVPAVLRRSRGYAPEPVARFPFGPPLLAVGGDLKNAIALVVEGQAFVSQHVGDLDHFAARASHAATIRDLCGTYEVDPATVAVAHDAHPDYVSAMLPSDWTGKRTAVQHHRAHVASVLAERSAWTTDVVGVAFDGTGYGDDGTIWGGEFFTGNLRDGFARSGHLRSAALPGGDAAAKFPLQAAAGFLADVSTVHDLSRAPFEFGERYRLARRLVESSLRCFATTSMGRLFDTVAALAGFTRAMTFEGQAAMWLEQLAGTTTVTAAYRFTLENGEIDYRPVLGAIVEDRAAGRDPGSIARGFHVAVADAVALVASASPSSVPVVCSGGVFQNRLLAELVRERLGTRAWFNAAVPPNDGGLCLGQAALAAAPSFFVAA